MNPDMISKILVKRRKDHRMRNFACFCQRTSEDSSSCVNVWTRRHTGQEERLGTTDDSQVRLLQCCGYYYMVCACDFVRCSIHTVLGS
uniref:Uncharacterized protein n=1 Tax=Romanomermis culicivorax TaxID=13658 RepID=A0A915K1T8_ROMCU